jgi:hypothetical protein
LQGIDFEVKQNEEQLIFNRQQMGFATAPITSLARLFVPDMMGDISFPDLFKRVAFGACYAANSRLPCR